MKKLREKLKTKSFWVCVAGLLTLLLSRLGVFNAASVAQSIAEGVGGVLVALGVISSPTGSEKKPAGITETDSEKSEKQESGEE